MRPGSALLLPSPEGTCSWDSLLWTRRIPRDPQSFAALLPGYSRAAPTGPLAIACERARHILPTASNQSPPQPTHYNLITATVRGVRLFVTGL